ncbi:MAG: CbrC family protein [Gemmatimonadaceae bacterium]
MNEASANLPLFKYHPDPIASGSIEASTNTCSCCDKARGFIYTGPTYSEDALENALCPWCIADGSAHRKFDATFVDSEAFDDGAPEVAMNTISERTPGFNSWQTEKWPSCCDEPAAFITPAGADDIRTKFPRLEGTLMMYIVQQLGISGGAATRMLSSLKRDQSPTAFVFQCLHCDGMPAYVDTL